jgi:Domain of unknown function (DUF4279)
MKESEKKYIYSTLILRGNELNPQEVTDSLKINPSMSFKRGDWRNETDKWEHNFWSLSSQDKIQSSNMATHLEWLLNQLEPIKLRLLEILNREGISAEISCFWIFPTDHENITLSPELIQKIADLSVSLSIEFYCP